MDLPTLAGKPIRRGRRLSWVGIYVYPCGNTAVAEGGRRDQARPARAEYHSSRVNTTRRPGRALAGQAVAACAAAGLESISGGLRGRGRRKTKERGESPASRPKSAEIDEQGRLITGLSAPLWLSLELFPPCRSSCGRQRPDRSRRPSVRPGAGRAASAWPGQATARSRHRLLLPREQHRSS